MNGEQIGGSVCGAEVGRGYGDTVSESPAVVEAEPAEPTALAEPAPLPPLELRDGLPAVTETLDDLDRVVRDLTAGTGPIAVDTERASGYRYGQRAYLIQIRREGSGSSLIDPHAVPGVPGLAEALRGPEWILHAASQDLPCLAELGLAPTSLFDTELAGRLLGMPRVGLGPMVEDVLGVTLAKGHGAADWSRRPLPEDWLEYAALDVEVLIELRTELRGRLQEAGKLEWAEQEFAAIRDAPPPAATGRSVAAHVGDPQDPLPARAGHRRAPVGGPGPDRPGGRHRARTAAAGLLDRRRRPRTPPRPERPSGDQGLPRSWRDPVPARMGAPHCSDAWAVPEKDLPLAVVKGDGPPPPRAWAQRDPVAAARLDRARAGLQQLAEKLDLPVENLITPDLVRRVMWQPPAGRRARCLRR